MSGAGTLSMRLRRAAARLAEAGVDSARVDAELLAAYVLGVPRGALLLIGEITDAQAEVLDRLVELRAQRIPLQHLTGTAPFLGRDLLVGPGVFIPRPETELLARWGVEALREVRVPTVLDLCSGTGALAVTVADARPDARVYAVERGEGALPWLRRNVEGTGVVVVEGDVRDVALPQAVDLVLCNPPYVPSTVAVPPEVGHDPQDAVFAGPDGLELIPVIVTRSAAVLRPGGQLGIEHDDTHTDAMRELLSDGFTEIMTHPDLAGRPRFTTAVRSGGATA
ncbi:peptide chain release factor N(5)-glutamine methyltransferase [Catellatospora tritici]|uniref:peptide chain release factor N(5)-glutamine methyltransferase n=1 Tax=Catellatospora tritici TaxID=2851566 RepID=UPI001C2CC7C1|nr:peptide chain release factor N(5)-glutamine methyltransferase [Catellatospora tritici]MBV1848859.1 peptide chain release factor N(5)-glutamine methyltransferase [Catellatospora tritici]